MPAVAGGLLQVVLWARRWARCATALRKLCAPLTPSSTRATCRAPLDLCQLVAMPCVWGEGGGRPALRHRPRPLRPSSPTTYAPPFIAPPAPRQSEAVDPDNLVTQTDSKGVTTVLQKVVNVNVYERYIREEVLSSYGQMDNIAWQAFRDANQGVRIAFVHFEGDGPARVLSRYSGLESHGNADKFWVHDRPIVAADFDELEDTMHVVLFTPPTLDMNASGWVIREHNNATRCG